MEREDGYVESEFSNVAGLRGGIDVDNVKSFLGRVITMTPIKQVQAINSAAKPAQIITTDSDNSRMEMEKKFPQLPVDIREGLTKKRLQLVETRFFVTKDVSGGKNFDLITGQDVKAPGIANFANGKLEKDNWFILSAIRMQYAVGVASVLDADFGAIPALVRNGEFELEVGNKKLIGLTDNEWFDTRNMDNVQIGYYKLRNTKLIEPQVEIKMPIKFSANAPAQSWLKVTFIGTSVIPY